MGGAGGTGGAGGAGGIGGAGGAGGDPNACAALTPPPNYPVEKEQNNLKQTANVLAMGAKGFTAGICPTGDVDVFRVDVTMPGSSLSVKTSDGNGGCPVGAQTYVRVFDANGVLAKANPGACASLNPMTDPGLGGLTAGTYYIQVESGNGMPIPQYIVDATLTAPGCGDGVLQFPAGEQCDDANMAPNDGCSPTCQLENGPYVNETEPNNSGATGNALAGFKGAVGQINPIGDQDYFVVDVTVAGSSLYALVNDGKGQCPSGFDSKMYLYDANNVLVASDDDSGPSACSMLDPMTDPLLTNLAVGKYKLMVEDLNNNDLQSYYVLDYSVKAPGCGDGFLQVGEQCDDSNLANGDGCSSTCHLEKNFVPETEPNGALSPNALPMGADGFIGSINPAGDNDFFTINVTVPGSSLFAKTSNGYGGCPAGADTKIFLLDANSVQLATDDNGGVSPCSLISPINSVAATNLAVGTYYVQVQSANATKIPTYILELRVTPPGCGDGVLQNGEQCDDGNNTSNDGCSSACVVEPPYELEPNPDRMTATPAWPGISHWIGSIAPLGDHDFFAFTVPMGMGMVKLETHDVGNAATCGFDTKIYLWDAMGATFIGSDDDSGISSCSLLSKAVPPGNYFVEVQRFNDSQTIGAYQIDLTIQ
jgi:cysteine-rich repeat protein